MKLLLIDDDPLEHKIFRKFLGRGTNAGAELISSIQLDDAIAHLKATEFDFIFLDDRLSPYASLVETLPLIRPYISKAKIFAISSSLDSPHLKEAKYIGVDKIFDKSDLNAVLSSDLSDIF